MSAEISLDEDLELKCVFFEKCSLPKINSLCYKSPDFLICPEYKMRKEKITK